MKSRIAGLLSLLFVASSCALTWEKDGSLYCTEDTHCDANEKCLIFNETRGHGRCSNEDACNDVSDCAKGEVCRDYSCVEPTCRDDEACFPFNCNVERGACETECSSEPDFRCADADGVSCRDFVCVYDDCGSDPAEDCGDYACRGSECLTSCQNDSECASGRYCSEASCVAGRPIGDECYVDDECSSGQCFENGCIATCADAGYECGTLGDQDCGSCGDANYCRGTVCEPRFGLGEYCESNEECLTDYCDFRECAERLPVGESCFNDDECLSGHCDNSYTCADPLGLNATCESDSQCESESCCYSATYAEYVCSTESCE